MRKFIGASSMNNSQELSVLAECTGIFKSLGISYAIGGSMASSVYGKVRFTQDADITVEPFDGKAEDFYQAFKSSFYISKQAIYQALKTRSSFNIIHLESAFKIDVFVTKNTDYEKNLISRSKNLKIPEIRGNVLCFLSPEDIILMKLCWYRDGDCSSQKQWDDVISVLEIQAEKLDFGYLNKWALKLNIKDFFENAVSQSKK